MLPAGVAWPLTIAIFSPTSRRTKFVNMHSICSRSSSLNIQLGLRLTTCCRALAHHPGILPLDVAWYNSCQVALDALQAAAGMRNDTKRNIKKRNSDIRGVFKKYTFLLHKAEAAFASLDSRTQLLTRLPPRLHAITVKLIQLEWLHTQPPPLTSDETRAFLDRPLFLSDLFAQTWSCSAALCKVARSFPDMHPCACLTLARVQALIETPSNAELQLAVFRSAGCACLPLLRLKHACSALATDLGIDAHEMIEGIKRSVGEAE